LFPWFKFIAGNGNKQPTVPALVRQAFERRQEGLAWAAV